MRTISGNFEGIKTRKFGVEIEMTGLTRCSAAKALQKVLGGEISHLGGVYDKYRVTDEKGRTWNIVSDGSIRATRRNGSSADNCYRVEMNSPVLEFEDLDLLQKVIRALRADGAITGPQYNCGTHIHIDAVDYTPQQIRNLVNIWSSKEDYLWDALQVCYIGGNIVPDFQGYSHWVAVNGFQLTENGYEFRYEDTISLNQRWVLSELIDASNENVSYGPEMTPTRYISSLENAVVDSFV